MTPFEDELKKALARQEPSPDFAARVLAKTAAQESPALWPASAGFARRRFFFSGLSLRFATLAALVLLLVAGFAYRRHIQIEKGEAAKKQLLVAMHIAGAQLRQAQLRVKRIEFPEVVMQ